MYGEVVSKLATLHEENEKLRCEQAGLQESLHGSRLLAENMQERLARAEMVAETTKQSAADVESRLAATIAQCIEQSQTGADSAVADLHTKLADALEASSCAAGNALEVASSTWTTRLEECRVPELGQKLHGLAVSCDAFSNKLDRLEIAIATIQDSGDVPHNAAPAQPDSSAREESNGSQLQVLVSSLHEKTQAELAEAVASVETLRMQLSQLETQITTRVDKSASDQERSNMEIENAAAQIRQLSEMTQDNGSALKATQAEVEAVSRTADVTGRASKVLDGQLTELAAALEKLQIDSTVKLDDLSQTVSSAVTTLSSHRVISSEEHTKCSLQCDELREVVSRIRDVDLKTIGKAVQAHETIVQTKVDTEDFARELTSHKKCVEDLGASVLQLDTRAELEKTVAAVTDHTSGLAALQSELADVRGALTGLSSSQDSEAWMEQANAQAAELQALRGEVRTVVLKQAGGNAGHEELGAQVARLATGLGEVTALAASQHRETDHKISEMQRDGEACQDALQERVDAFEAWLLQVEETASAVDDLKSTLDAGTAALKAELTAAICSVDEEHKNLLRKVATGIKSSMEATESKVLQLLQQHVALFDDKVSQYDGRIDQISTALQDRLGLAVTRNDFQAVCDENSERVSVLEAKLTTVLVEAQEQVCAAESSIAMLQAEWRERSSEEEKQQEPLSIRISNADVRQEDSGSKS